MASVPAFTVVTPPKLLVPERVRVPVLFLVRPPAPVMLPAMPTAKLLVSIMPVLVMVTARVDGEVMPPVARRVPPLKMSVLLALPSEPVAVALRVPWLIVVEPV